MKVTREQITKEQKEEYDKYMNEQFKILQGHFDRIMLRCYNKFTEIVTNEK